MSGIGNRARNTTKLGCSLIFMLSFCKLSLLGVLWIDIEGIMDEHDKWQEFIQFKNSATSDELLLSMGIYK